MTDTPGCDDPRGPSERVLFGMWAAYVLALALALIAAITLGVR